jgi:hypothetical protein
MKYKMYMSTISVDEDQTDTELMGQVFLKTTDKQTKHVEVIGTCHYPVFADTIEDVVYKAMTNIIVIAAKQRYPDNDNEYIKEIERLMKKFSGV